MRKVVWNPLELPPRIVDKLAEPPTDSDSCWIWTGALSKNAPKISDGKTSINVRGVLFKLITGRPLIRWHARMKCKTPFCISPFHVEDKADPSLTPLIYSRRRRFQEHPERPIWFKKEGFCRSGHLITGKNIYWMRSHGMVVGRRCKLCAYTKMQKMGYGFAPGGVLDQLRAEFEPTPLR